MARTLTLTLALVLSTALVAHAAELQTIEWSDEAEYFGYRRFAQHPRWPTSWLMVRDA